MIRNRTFHLAARHNDCLWDSFEEAYQYFVKNKDKVEQTFKEVVFDKTFNEPMNSIILDCDQRNPEVNKLQEYAKKLNDLFSDNDDKIVIDTRISNMPVRYRKKVSVEHCWFIKEAI